MLGAAVSGGGQFAWTELLENSNISQIIQDVFLTPVHHPQDFFRQKMDKILLIDNDPMFCGLLRDLPSRIGCEFKAVQSLENGMREITRRDYDLVLLNVTLSNGDGLRMISNIQAVRSSPEVIALASKGDPNDAETAIKNGAWDYVEKTIPADSMELLVKRALRHRTKKLRLAPKKALDRTSIVGDSPRLRLCLDILAQAASSTVNVLITGETGTGKELFAKAIHDNSPNAENKFVVVDCTNIPPMLAESLLFGHVRGSFTGAFESKVGLIRQAHQGTLFLDEIGDLPLSVQRSLLRVLQGRKFRPLGSKHEQTSNFRLIAATNGDMKVMVRAGRFRKDLYHRLSALNIHLPPLRERMEDLGPLTDYYIAKICGERGVPAKQVSEEFFRALEAYDWPGNIRELINILSSSVANAMDGSTLYPQHLPMNFRIHLARMNFKPDRPGPSGERRQPDIRQDVLDRENFPTFKKMRETTIRRMELCYLDELVSLCNGDMAKACQLSGLSRARLYELFRRHNIVLKG